MPGAKNFKVQVSFGITNAPLLSGLRDINKGFDEIQRSAKKNFGEVERTLVSINRTIGTVLLATGAAMIGLGVQAGKMSGEFERLAVTFEVLSGSAEKADTLIREIKEFAAKTPLQLIDIQKAATMMLGFGYSIDEVLPKLKLFGEAAAVMRLPVEQIIRVREFLASGSFRSYMLAPLGISRREFEEYGALFDPQGQLMNSVEESLDIFDKILEDRFSGLFDKIFGTITARVSNIIDQVQLTFAGLGDAMKPVIVEILDFVEINFNRLRSFLEENSQTVGLAFQRIGDNIKAIFAPIILAFDNFMKAIEIDPYVLVDLANGFNVLVDAILGLYIINSISLAYVRFLPILAKLQTFVIGVNTAFNALGLSIAGFSLTLGPVVGIITGIIALLVVWIQHNRTLHAALVRNTEEINNNINSLREERTELLDVGQAVYKSILTNDKSEASYQKITNAIKDLIEKYPEYKDKLHITIDETGKLYDANGDVIDSFDDLESTLNGINLQGFIDELNRSMEQAYSLRDAIEAATKAQSNWVNRLSNYTRSTFGMEPYQTVVTGQHLGSHAVYENGQWVMRDEGALTYGTGEYTQSQLDLYDRIWSPYAPQPQPETEDEDEEPGQGPGGSGGAQEEYTQRLKETNRALEAWKEIIDMRREQDEDYWVQMEMAKDKLIDIQQVRDQERDSLIAIVEKLYELEYEFGLTAEQSAYLKSILEELSGSAKETSQQLGVLGNALVSLVQRIQGLINQINAAMAQAQQRTSWGQAYTDAFTTVIEGMSQDIHDQRVQEILDNYFNNYASPEERLWWKRQQPSPHKPAPEEEEEEVEESIWQPLYDALISGARELGEAIANGDIRDALNSVFEQLGKAIAQIAEQYISEAIGGLMGGVLGAFAGGLIGGLASKLFGKKKNRGEERELPIYVHVVNFNDERLGSYLPFTFMLSGRSNYYNVDYRGASMDRMSTDRQLGLHYGR